MDIIYNTKLEIYSSFLIDYKFFNYFSLIKQYQFIQTDKKEYLIKLIKINEIFNQEKSLIQEFKNDLGEDSIIKIEYVTEIPPLSSGKIQKILNAHYRKILQLKIEEA